MNGFTSGLLAALLMGVSLVFNKAAVTALGPVAAAAYTYLATGLLLLPWGVGRGMGAVTRPLDWVLWLGAGAVAAPMLFFAGLHRTPGSVAGLLGNLQAVFTALIAVLLFRERLSLRAILGGALILLPAFGLALGGRTGHGAPFPLGPWLIALAHLAWALENNLARRLGDVHPGFLVSLKGLTAALVLLPAAGGRSPLPALLPIVGAAACLGLSLALFYRSLRLLGSARAGLLFGSSAIWGAAAAVVWLKEPLTLALVVAGSLMLVGLQALSRPDWG